MKLPFELRVVALPMVTKFRGLTVRETALIEGPHGWGEFSVFDDYNDKEAALWLLSAVESAFVRWPKPLRTEIPVNATVPAVSADEVSAVLARFDGCTVAKIKVAEGDDLARVKAVLSHLGPEGKIRVDANGGWSVEEALVALTHIAEVAGDQLEYAEQPCKSVEELAEVRRRLQGVVKIAADESIRRSEDPYRVRDLQAADVVVIKVAPLGGVARSLELLHEIEMPAVVSSELSSSIGIQAGLALAASMPDLPYACGLATTELFVSDVTSQPLRPAGGVISVRTVTPDLTGGLAVSNERQSWWEQRALAAWQAGTAELAHERGWL